MRAFGLNGSELKLANTPICGELPPEKVGALSLSVPTFTDSKARERLYSLVF
jgi:hypothetical protein